MNSPAIVKELTTPFPGFYAIANQRSGFYDINQNYQAFEAGQIALITEVNNGTSMAKWFIKVLLEETDYTINKYDLSSFIFSPVSSRLAGKSFCITGELTYIRPSYASFIKLNGGEYKNTITSKVDYLICNSGLLNSTKIRKAKALGIKIIDEDLFFKICYGHVSITAK